MTRLTGDQIEALMDTLCKAFWNKRPFADFLRRSGVSPDDIRQLGNPPTVTKREFLCWLFQRYEMSPRGNEIMRDIAVSLTAKTVFSDLEPETIKVAKVAIDSLRSLFPSMSVKKQSMESVGDATARTDVKVSPNVDQFRAEFLTLQTQLGTSHGGTAFEEWALGIKGGFSQSGYETPSRYLPLSQVIKCFHALALVS